MTKKKKILILGGGSSQLNLLQKCLSQNLYTILADINPDAPGRKYCSEFVKVSTFDREGVLAAAAELSVDAVATAGTDQPVYTAAFTCEKLGLPRFLSAEEALSVTNKLVMKKIFKDSNIRTADYIHVDKNTSTGRIRELKPPYVLKPADSQGQRGIAKLHTAAEVLKHLDYTLSFSREKTAILEEYYDSDEITLSGWLIGGRLYILAVTDRVRFDNLPAIGICSSHQYPSPYIWSHKEEILSLTEKIVSSFCLKEGPVYFQYLPGRDGIYVNEIACRLGGAYEDEFFPHILGIDTVSLLIKGSMGERITESDLGGIKKSEISFSGIYGTVMLFFTKPGIIKDLKTPDDLLCRPELKVFKYIINKQAEIRPVANSTQRAGYAVLCSSSRDDLVKASENVINSASVTGSAGENLLDADPEKFVYQNRRRFQ